MQNWSLQKKLLVGAGVVAAAVGAYFGGRALMQLGGEVVTSDCMKHFHTPYDLPELVHHLEVEAVHSAAELAATKDMLKTGLWSTVEHTQLALKQADHTILIKTLSNAKAMLGG